MGANLRRIRVRFCHEFFDNKTHVLPCLCRNNSCVFADLLGLRIRIRSAGICSICCCFFLPPSFFLILVSGLKSFGILLALLNKLLESTLG